jgi:hypothetical protein
MSIPIVACNVFKAARGDEEAFQNLVEAMKYNIECGHYSQFSCMCNPPCQAPPDEAIKAVEIRLNQELDKWKATRKKK